MSKSNDGNIMIVIYFLGFCILIGSVGSLFVFIVDHYKIVLTILFIIALLILSIFIIKKIYNYKLDKKIEQQVTEKKKKLYDDNNKNQLTQTYKSNTIEKVTLSTQTQTAILSDSLIEEEYNHELTLKQREYAKQVDFNPVEHKKYESKSLISRSEKYFLDIIDSYFGSNYRIQPQVPLSSIVDKNKDFYKQYQNELYRTIDIGIFDKNTYSPLLMIEINDKTHAQTNRYKRDLKVREILKIASIPLITFYTNMPNKPTYIINRVKQNLK